MGSLKFIVGRAGSGKTTACFDELIRKLEEGERKLLFLVPEQSNLQMQKTLADKLGYGLLDVEVVSFNVLARNLFGEVGKKEVTIVEDLERMIILRRIIEKHRNDISYYKKNIGSTGFLETINRFITILEQSGIDAEALSEIKNIENAGELYRSKFEDLESIVRYFNEYIGDNFITTEKNMMLACDAIKSSNKLSETYVWIDGFYGFTYTQLQMIYELAKKTKGITITLPMDRKYGFTERVNISNTFFESIIRYQDIARFCVDNNIDYTVEYLQPKVEIQKDASLLYLEKYYTARFQKKFDGVSNVFLHKYSSRTAECEQMAREIARLTKEEGYRYHDIAVVVGDLEEYRSHIITSMRSYSIPYFLDMNRNIHTNALVALIECLVEVITTGYSYASIISLLRTNMLGVTQNEIDILENYILAYGIKGRKRWQEPWNFERDEEAQAKINEIKEKVYEPIRFFDEYINNREQGTKLTIKYISVGIYHFLNKIKAYDKVQEIIKRYADEGNRLLELENKQVWNKVIEVFERLVDIIGDEKISMKEYKKILETSFSYIKMGIIPPSRDQVIVGTVDRTRLQDIKVCFVLGTNEGLIPKVENSNELFSDMDKIAIEAGCSGGAKTRFKELLINKPLYGENFNVYNLLTKPSDKLYVYASNADENGKFLRISNVYKILCRMFDEVIEEDTELSNIRSQSAAMDYLAIKLREYVDDRYIESDVWKDLLSYFEESERWKTRLDILKENMFYTNVQDTLSQKAKEMLYNESVLKTNITRLEKFRQCPCGYFFRYGIKAEDRAIFNLDKAKVGTMFHSVLENYPRHLKEQGATWVTATKEQTNEAINISIEDATRHINRNQKEQPSFKYTLSRLKKASKRAINALTIHLKNGEFEPMAYELTFGEDGKLPPIVIDIDEGRRVEIKGTIDRVDAYYSEENGTYVKILDYKSGNKKFSLEEAYYGLQLQLLLYLDAYLKINSEYKEGGVFYFHINNPYVDYEVGMNEDKLKEKELAQFKLSGLVIDDLDIIEAIDKDYKSIGVSVTTKGELSKKSPVATKMQFEMLEDHVVELIRRLGEEILDGKVSISPYNYNNRKPYVSLMSRLEAIIMRSLIKFQRKKSGES